MVGAGEEMKEDAEAEAEAEAEAAAEGAEGEAEEEALRLLASEVVISCLQYSKNLLALICTVWSHFRPTSPPPSPDPRRPSRRSAALWPERMAPSIYPLP